jgi:hypothetical protein
MAAFEEEPLVGSARAMVIQIEHLHRAISDAISAISRNAVPSFEESLNKQEVLCAALNHLLQTLGEEQVSHAAIIRIQATMEGLHTLNRSYGNLVEQSRASNHLLYALCARYNESAIRGTRAQMAARYSVEV